MNKKDKATKIINELNEMGLLDKACQIEFLLENYSNIFKSVDIEEKIKLVESGTSNFYCFDCYDCSYCF